MVFAKMRALERWLMKGASRDENDSVGPDRNRRTSGHLSPMCLARTGANRFRQLRSLRNTNKAAITKYSFENELVSVRVD